MLTRLQLVKNLILSDLPLELDDLSAGKGLIISKKLSMHSATYLLQYVNHVQSLEGDDLC